MDCTLESSYTNMFGSYLSQEFLRDVQNIFESTRFRVNSIRDFLRNIQDTRQVLDVDDSRLSFVEFLIKKLCVDFSSDPRFLAVIINLYCAIQPGMDDHVMHHLTPGPNLTNVCDGVDYRLLYLDGVLTDGNWPFLKFLIRYGIIRHSEWEFVMDKPEMLKCKTMDKFVKIQVEVNEMLNGPNLECKTRRMRTVLTVLKLIRTDLRDVTVKCFKYYFEVIPEPYVTEREIEELVQASPLERRLKERLERCFPGSDVLRPRTLRHLSRCAARSHLCKRGVLPLVVSSLQMPSAIKDYILVINEKDESW